MTTAVTESNGPPLLEEGGGSARARRTHGSLASALAIAALADEELEQVVGAGEHALFSWSRTICLSVFCCPRAGVQTALPAA